MRKVAFAIILLALIGVMGCQPVKQIGGSQRSMIDSGAAAPPRNSDHGNDVNSAGVTASDAEIEALGNKKPVGKPTGQPPP